jgi:hypothetical protein
MLSMTHLDGADVVVVDCEGRQVPSVTEVRVEPDRAFVAVSHSARAWWQALRERAPQELALVIRSRDGRLDWSGPVHLACV